MLFQFTHLLEEIDNYDFFFSSIVISLKVKHITERNLYWVNNSYWELYYGRLLVDGFNIIMRWKSISSYYKSSSVCLSVCLSVVPYLLRGPLTDLRQTWWVYVGGPRNCPWGVLFRKVNRSTGQRVTFTFNYIIYVPASLHTAAKGGFAATASN